MAIPAIAAASLIMVTRYPQPGETKTRLIPALGAEGAAQLQRQMTEHLLTQFQRLCEDSSLTLEVHFAGGSLRQMRQWLGTEVIFNPQCTGNLGQRLNYAFAQGFATGKRPILVVGSDCPGIGKAQINQAIGQLRTDDVVLGPATDGGYYLIGLNALQPQLFEGICWGQSCVLQQTIAIATAHHLTVALLDPLPDIDRPEDLPLWETYSGAVSSSPQARL